MSITGALVLFATLFFLVLFLLLPWGHRSQEEAGAVVPGTPAGAPDRPMLRKKGLIAALIAALLVALVWWVIQQGWITRAAMMDFNRR
ncbi:DUF1467 family protein [Paracoccus panacisoli]|uniref:Predicted secreted protein n=2 Tax=Paracoccus TaxID=265 RepID=A0A099G8S1_9RHOB|nr:DUF1467 family protein [Paracoccus sanguinis]KGJ15006.1 hypothetical protein IX54_03885 [Paracoccus sanguinis]KGJ15352.1 hypothetical protein IX55_15985 [Paracoccus sanguinis]KGJ18992.1 hypothetical protein IX57_02065 [Paracoccus sanguinis]QJD17646.1 DUF1467 family protein [Paracoccus sanguinis]SDW21154.1 Predicted secreted protein [Paracoccus sanguinis]